MPVLALLSLCRDMMGRNIDMTTNSTGILSGQHDCHTALSRPTSKSKESRCHIRSQLDVKMSTGKSSWRRAEAGRTAHECLEAQQTRRMCQDETG